MAYQEEIYEAIKNNDGAKMEELLNRRLRSCINKKLKIQTEQYMGVMSALCLAVIEGDPVDTTIIQLLLKNGANPQKRRDWRIPSILPTLTEFLSPMSMAIREQNITVLKLLLEAGASANETSPGLKVQEEEGGSMLYRDTQETCLHRAVLMKNPAMVELLITKGADVNALNRDDQTPLHCCGHRYHPQVFRHLLCGGAMASNVDQEGQSVLGLLLKPQQCDDGVEFWTSSEIQDRIESVHLLLSAGYHLQRDVHVRNVVGETTLNPNINGICQDKLFMVFINNRLTNPPSLDFLCCIAIRQFLRYNCHLSVVDSLPLPQKLKDYILLKT
ncbi:ankyrin repeat and SOCS box protein 8-like [Haliotis cracherodii]|uniref:ankyrin repeat and SOCS box protein 8-like n=1 Tax=Haliotis cracherodii TaxID=6455 RepID=UPI0039E7D055